MARGSTWKRWDLRVHSPESFYHEFSFETNAEKEGYGGDIWGKYVKTLEAKEGISVLGITDYFSIDGYEKIQEYLGSGRLQNFDLVLPNIEFRLDQFVDGSAIEYHIIFSEKLDPEEIKKQFLHELHVITQEDEKRPLSKGNIEEIGKNLINTDPSISGDPHTVGCEHITVSLDEIIDVLRDKSSIFEGKYMLVLENKGWDKLSWEGRPRTPRQILLSRSDAIFCSNPETIKWALGQKEKDMTPEDIVDKFNSLKPSIHGSDAHDWASIGNPAKDRFCWIKAKPTFNGLKQILYEPQDRVKIQTQSPTLKKNIHTVSSIMISNAEISREISLKEQDLNLNKNFVAITGGKGNGKTALLDILANCFQDRCERSGHDKNSFVQRIEDQKGDLETSLNFLGENVDNFSKELKEREFFKESKITYLPQGKIEEFSADRKELDKKIEEIIFRNKKVRSQKYREKFDSKREEIEEIGEFLSETNRRISKLQKKTREEVIEGLKNEKHVKVGKLADKKERLDKLTEETEENIKEELNDLNEKQENLQKKHSNLEAVKSAIEDFRVDLNDLKEEKNSLIERTNSKLSDLGVGKEIPKVSFSGQLEAIEEITATTINQIERVTNQIDKINEEINQLAGIKKTHTTLLNEIQEVKQEISSVKDQLNELRKKKEEIEDLKQERFDKYGLLIQKYWGLKDFYNNVIEVFSQGKSEILGEVEFKSRIFFDSEEFVKNGAQLLDQRKINLEDIENLADTLEGIIKQGREEASGEMESYVEEIFNFKEFLKSNRSNYDFYNWVFGDYFFMSPEIFFQNTPMNKLSMGQKGMVLLKLFLAEGDYPLIVDQPEESLDNKFIYDELVEAFREAKKERQIIIATNNANLIVNTDAEQIIVAEFDDNVISYHSGSIEDPQLRKNIMPILEGGEEAFKKREEKYEMT